MSDREPRPENPVPVSPEPERNPHEGWTPTSDGPTIIYAHPEDYVWGDLVNEGHRQNWTRLVPAAAFDAVVAERDALEVELNGAPCACRFDDDDKPTGECFHHKAIRAERDAANDLTERAWSLISEVMALAKCSQTREWLIEAKAWQRDYENGAGTP